MECSGCGDKMVKGKYFSNFFMYKGRRHGDTYHYCINKACEDYGKEVL